jgi:hypothetical protein
VTSTAVAEFLTQAHPEDTANSVEACCQANGFSVRAYSVNNWLSGKASPSGEHLLALIAIYGPALIARLLPNVPPWLETILNSV